MTCRESRGTRKPRLGGLLAVLASFFVAAVARAQEAAPAATPPIVDRRFFADERVNIMIPIITFTLFILFFIREARAGRSLFIRHIPGLDAIEEALGRATEMG